MRVRATLDQTDEAATHPAAKDLIILAAFHDQPIQVEIAARLNVPGSTQKALTAHRIIAHWITAAAITSACQTSW